jgi:hypothetical protein
MNRLYEIDTQEKLIAQGKYNYLLVGRNSGLKEEWSLHYNPEVGLIHRAEIRGRAGAIRLKQMTHFIMDSDYHPKQFEMSQDISGNETFTKLVCNDDIHQSITVDEKNTEFIIEVPEKYSLFFPPVSAQEFILRQYDMLTKGQQTMPLACVRIQPEEGLSLSIEMRPIIYEFIDEEDIETPVGKFSCYHYIRYDQHMEQQLWTDHEYRVIKWAVPYSPIMKWEYLLVEYNTVVNHHILSG